MNLINLCILIVCEFVNITGGMHAVLMIKKTIMKKGVCNKYFSVISIAQGV
jgi:hypothetical protein